MNIRSLRRPFGMPVILAALAACPAAALGQACPDNLPPAGSIGYVYKTLDQVEPRTPVNACRTPGDADSVYRITQAGSYYLTGNIQVTNGKKGIEIVVNDVTIDLNGFTISGNGAPTSLDGVFVGPSTQRIMIRNGSIADVAGTGIRASGANFSVVIEDLKIHGTTLNGACAVLPANSKAHRCEFLLGGAGGLVVGHNSIVTDCTARSNAGAGFQGSNATTFTNCVATDNTTPNGDGFRINGTNGRLTNCTAMFNQGDGFEAGAGTALADCTAANNSRWGVVHAGAGSIRGSTFSSNTLGGGSVDGFTHVTNCSFFFNVSTGATVPGLLVNGRGSRIDSNTFGDNGTGLRVTGDFNAIIRNTALMNFTPYNVGAGNTFFVTNVANMTSAFANFQP